MDQFEADKAEQQPIPKPTVATACAGLALVSRRLSPRAARARLKGCAGICGWPPVSTWATRATRETELDTSARPHDGLRPSLMLCVALLMPTILSTADSVLIFVANAYQGPGLRVMAALQLYVYFLTLIPLAAAGFLRGIRFGALPVVIVSSALLSAGVGVFSGTSAAYLVSEFARSLVTLMALLLYSVVFQGRDSRAWALKLLWRVEITNQTLFLGADVYFFATQGFTRIGGGSLLIFVLGMARLAGLDVPFALCRREAYFGLTLTVATVVLSLTRGLWLAYLAAALVILIGARDPRRRVTIILIATVVGTVLVPIIQSTSFGPVLTRRVQGTGASDYSISYRQAENRAVFQELETHPRVFFIGAGGGAELLVDPFGAPIHQIHNTYLAIWFRSGLIGLMALSYLLIQPLPGRGFRNPIARSYILGTAVLATSANGIYGDGYFAAFLALACLGLPSSARTSIR